MWISHRDCSSEQPPKPEQVEWWQRRMSPPENEFPAGVGVAALLASSDNVAVGLNQVEAFSTGFRFTLAVRVRQVPTELIRGELFMHITAHVPDLEIPLENRLLVGIEYSDGRRASTLGDTWTFRPDAEMGSDQLVLVPQGGGGSELAVDQSFWVAPLPPPGPVTVVLAWPGFGIEETRTVVDGDSLREASARSQTLWPPQSAAGTPQPAPLLAQPPGGSPDRPIDGTRLAKAAPGARPSCGIRGCFARSRGIGNFASATQARGHRAHHHAVAQALGTVVGEALALVHRAGCVVEER